LDAGFASHIERAQFLRNIRGDIGFVYWDVYQERSTRDRIGANDIILHGKRDRVNPSSESIAGRSVAIMALLDLAYQLAERLDDLLYRGARVLCSDRLSQARFEPLSFFS